MKSMDLQHFNNIRRYQTTTTSHQLKLLLQIIANLRAEVPKNSATFGLIPKEAAAAANTSTRNKAHFKETPMSNSQITQIPTIGRLLTHMKTNTVSK